MEANKSEQKLIGLRKDEACCLGVSGRGEVHEDLQRDEGHRLFRRFAGGYKQRAKNKSHPAIRLRRRSDANSISRNDELRFEASGRRIRQDALCVCR